MKYLCLIYDNQSGAAAMTREQGEALMGEYFAFTEAIKKSGQYVGGNIPGKPRRYLLNTGGRLKLFEVIADVVAHDYQAFEMSRSAASADAVT